MGDMFSFFAILVTFFYLTIIGVIFYLVYTWVNKFISLKKEQNDLLREIIKRMENKQLQSNWGEFDKLIYFRMISKITKKQHTDKTDVCVIAQYIQGFNRTYIDVRCKRKKIKPVQIDIDSPKIKIFITTNNLKEIDYATNFQTRRNRI